MRASASLALLLAAALGGCGDSQGSLSGSIGRTHPLGYQTVELRRLDSSYVVVYLREKDTVARLSYTPAGAVQVDAAAPLSFERGGNAGLSRATSDGLPFPPPRDGTFTFLTDPTPAAAGDEVRGRFGVQFTSGDTLSGTFAVPLQIAGR